jgi:enoyl-CoA hydratase
MVMFGERIDGRRAAEIGFAWQCHPDGELVDAALAMAARAATAPTELLGRIKASISDMHGIHSHEEAVDHELIAQVWSTGQPEFRERLAALQQQISGDS